MGQLIKHVKVIIIIKIKLPFERMNISLSYCRRFTLAYWLGEEV